uniref:Uncharacterized protein n=1 Tax=Arundo donax TaxID=35708 RepID=A0A0A9A5J3_ARUDO
MITRSRHKLNERQAFPTNKNCCFFGVADRAGSNKINNDNAYDKTTKIYSALAIHHQQGQSKIQSTAPFPPPRGEKELKLPDVPRTRRTGPESTPEQC